ncbi:hypothetical protein HK405_012796, partial [Cladochytrium tenue]
LLVLGTVDVLVALGDALLFTPLVGVFAVLSEVLPLLGSGGASAASDLLSTAASSAVGAPLFVGEFGCYAAAAFLDCPAFVRDMAAGLDAGLAAGWTQWDYAPQWTDDLKDGFNLEDLSVTEGVAGGYAARAAFLSASERPHVRAVAGTPSAVTVAQGSATVTYVVGSSTAAAATTDIFFNQTAACGAGAAAHIATSSGVTCAFDASHSLVSCTNSASAGSTVAVQVYC